MRGEHGGEVGDIDTFPGSRFVRSAAGRSRVWGKVGARAVVWAASAGLPLAVTQVDPHGHNDQSWLGCDDVLRRHGKRAASTDAARPTACVLDGAGSLSGCEPPA